MNHPTDVAAFDAQGLSFFDAWLKGTGGSKLAPGSVTAYTMVCPASKPAGGGPFKAKSFKGLAHGGLGFGSTRALKITSKGASQALATTLSGAAGPGALCTQLKPDRTSKATLRATSPGVTLIGQPEVAGRVSTKGRYGQLDARLWDLDPKTGLQRLITRGTYRLTDNQNGRFTFKLDGNGWRFAKRHRIVLELLGRDAPTYRPSPAPFSAKLTDLTVSLPVRR